MMSIVIISGSPSARSRLSGIVEQVKAAIAAEGQEWTEIAVRELPPADLLHAAFDSPAIAEAVGKVEQADAVVIATPIYKASYTGILKAFLDLLPQKGLERKIVLPVAIGGTIAHLLAIDYALKPVLAALGARHVLGGVFVQDTHVTWSEQGQAVLDAETGARLNGAVKELVRERRASAGAVAVAERV
ncbi:MAG: NADPH-dependent FMN reductase [Paenibacillaceae bacterium]|nr:NADPH-dependent FMN reductase [Paenibacillaceae bacterium]